MDSSRLSQRTRDALASLPPEKQERAREIIARTQTPEARARDAADRLILDREYRESGRIETLGEQAPLEVDRRIRDLVDELRQKRLEAGLSLEQLARRSCVDETVLSRLEDGAQANPSLGVLFRYAQGLGLDLDVHIHPTSDAPG